MDIIIGADHGGFDLKEECKAFLEKTGEYLKSCRPTAVNLAWAVDQGGSDLWIRDWNVHCGQSLQRGSCRTLP